MTHRDRLPNHTTHDPDATPAPDSLPLVVARTLIDRVDAAIVGLSAIRRAAVRVAASAKPPGNRDRDRIRENQVRDHAWSVATDLGIPPESAVALVSLLINDACQQQGLPMDTQSLKPLPGPGSDPADPHQGVTQPIRPNMGPMNTEPLLFRLAAFLPPPSAWAPLVRRLPRPTDRMRHGIEWVLGSALASGDLAFLEGRTIGIDVTDLQLSLRVGLRDGKPRLVHDNAEASVRGTLTDLLQLASRREDADTLFFQRRLVLTGDTELGLFTRNVLDRIDWQSLPLALRIPLHRAADWTARIRALHRQPGSWALPGPSRQ